MKKVEEDNNSKDKDIILKIMGHVREDYEASNELFVKENELVLNDVRRILIRERRQ